MKQGAHASYLVRLTMAASVAALCAATFAENAYAQGMPGTGPMPGAGPMPGSQGFSNQFRHTSRGEHVWDQPESKKAIIVDYYGPQARNSLVVDGANNFLYRPLGNNKAKRYYAALPKQGADRPPLQSYISSKAEYPDWTPPPDMLQRNPALPKFVPGGVSNPMGAARLVLGNTLYRVHGTNVPSQIGFNVSSGCVRLYNKDVQELYREVPVGARFEYFPNGLPAEYRVSPAKVSFNAMPDTQRVTLQL